MKRNEMKGDSVRRMSKQTQYEAGRLDGLDLARRIVQDQGIEALEKECRMRGAWGINLALATKDLDKATEKMKELCYKTILIASLSVLHDRFGFGQIRCQRFVDGFAKLTAYLDHGWLYWYDLIEELRQQLDLRIDTSSLTTDSMGKVYRHPEPGDVYTEPDLVDADEWKSILRRLNFSEDNDGWVLDENGNRFIHYDGNFEKIQAYDTLYGVELAKDHWGIK